jgi:hypothetical protein
MYELRGGREGGRDVREWLRILVCGRDLKGIREDGDKGTKGIKEMNKED